ncbi:putative F-box protein At1g58310 [Vicia villosa]|uniref:putative F-box protein At1g58310 n=1 Tax=Vicia villosa TaxID=3911 RepID=UPI00273AFA21|nr:putative F-box protein At1g58310 [Vicia villosa]
MEMEVGEENKDRFSDLPDCVLLRILKFMNTKHAVQTCVLSTRWTDLWKSLTNLDFNSHDFISLYYFNNFVYQILSHRDDSISLRGLDLRRRGCIEPELLDRVMTYGVSHNVRKFRVEVNLYFKHDFKLHPCIFSCQTLTYLKLSVWAVPSMTELPTSLQLPVLKSLHLEHVTFVANGDGCAEPFSNCHMLKNLVLDRCNLHCNAKFLTVSNSSISCLTIGSTIQEVAYKIVISTPNLSSLTVMRDLIHEVSACNLCFLEEVNIDVEAYFHTNLERTYSVLVSWLQVFANYVQTMTLSSSTLNILNVLLTTDSMISQFPCCARLKLLKLEMKSSSSISDEVVSRIVKFLLKKSPLAKVDMIDCE